MGLLTDGCICEDVEFLQRFCTCLYKGPIIPPSIVADVCESDLVKPRFEENNGVENPFWHLVRRHTWYAEPSVRMSWDNVCTKLVIQIRGIIERPIKDGGDRKITETWEVAEERRED